MALIFLDTNALLKLYLSEVGSTWLENYIAPHSVVISELALFESATVLRRKSVEGNLTRNQVIDLFGQIRLDSHNYQIIALGGTNQMDRLANLVFNLPTNLRVRALDSLHLTAATIAFEAASSLNPPEPFVFISSDRQLLQVAQAQGFSVENPEAYP
jgi:predicted nucleic acid-binding protein